MPLMVVGSVVAVASPASAEYVTCFHRGNLLNNDQAYLKVDWNDDGSTDECFGIAPNRTIWHDWATSGRWVQMPDADGRADIVAFHLVPAEGWRRIVVGAGTPAAYYLWYQDFVPGRGWSGNWQRCVPTVC